MLTQGIINVLRPVHVVQRSVPVHLCNSDNIANRVSLSCLQALLLRQLTFQTTVLPPKSNKDPSV